MKPSLITTSTLDWPHNNTDLTRCVLQRESRFPLQPVGVEPFPGARHKYHVSDTAINARDVAVEHVNLQWRWKDIQTDKVSESTAGSLHRLRYSQANAGRGISTLYLIWMDQGNASLRWDLYDLRHFLTHLRLSSIHVWPSYYYTLPISWANRLSLEIFVTPGRAARLHVSGVWSVMNLLLIHLRVYVYVEALLWKHCQFANVPMCW